MNPGGQVHPFNSPQGLNPANYHVYSDVAPSSAEPSVKALSLDRKPIRDSETEDPAEPHLDSRDRSCLRITVLSTARLGAICSPVMGNEHSKSRKVPISHRTSAGRFQSRL